jgi:hypothetical protein
MRHEKFCYFSDSVSLHYYCVGFLILRLSIKLWRNVSKLEISWENFQ